LVYGLDDPLGLDSGICLSRLPNSGAIRL